MSFVLYDLIFLAVFTIAVVIFLYTRRHNLKREGIMYLYRTRVGIKFMDWTVDKFGPILRPLQYIIIASGYILMVAMIWFLAQFTYVYTTSKLFVQAVKVPPILPLVPYLPELFKVNFLPPFYFTYWIIIIAIIAISHEFAHGIFARLHKVKIKSTGFGFLGPFLAAFVEPDENQVKKTKKVHQLAFIAAGTFANVLMTILFGLILWWFFAVSFHPAGVVFNSYANGVIPIAGISGIGGVVSLDNQSILFGQNITRVYVGEKSYLISQEGLKKATDNNYEYVNALEDAPAVKAGLSGPILEIDGVKTATLDGLRAELMKHSPGDDVKIKTVVDGKTEVKDIVLGNNNGSAYLGVGFASSQRTGISGYLYKLLEKVKNPAIYYEPNWGTDFAWFVYNLLWWIVLINLSVALVNMLPVGIFDGGRFFYLTIWGITGNEKFAKWAFKFTTWLFIAVFVWLTLRWALAIF